MQKKLIIILVLFFTFACKKAEEKVCFKPYGETTELSYSLPDNITEFKLYNNINYHIYQDSLQIVKIIGGENLIQHISLNQFENQFEIRNHNKCNFLRNFDKKITVEIHYPNYTRFYSETADSLIFKDTINSNYFYLTQTLGGGYVKLNIAGDKLIMIGSNGVSTYEVSGKVNYADLRLQTDAKGICTNLICPEFEIDQNSTGDLFINGDSAKININMKGTGNVYYSGNPDSIAVKGIGVGQILKN